MNKCLCRHNFANNLGKYLWVGLLDHIVTTMLSFVRNGWTAFPSGCTILHSALNESSCCSMSSPIFGVVSVPDFSYSNKWIVVSHCSYNFKFPNDKWCYTSYHTLSCYNILKGMYSDPEIKLSTVVVFSEKDRSSNFLVKVIFKHMNIFCCYCEWDLFWWYYLTGYLFI